MPNLISLLRIFIVPVFFTTLIYYQPDKDYYRSIALGLFCFASFTDALDGYLARIRKQVTHLGRFLDPLADKLLITSGYVGIFLAKDYPLVPPHWVVVAIVFRDLMIVGGLIVFYVSSVDVEVAPNFLGKLTTACQMATMISLLLLLPASEVLWNITALLTVASGLSYVTREMKTQTRSRKAK